MQQREREKCARIQRTTMSLTDIADQVHSSRHLVDAAFMAAHELSQNERAALTALLALISDKLKDTAEQIETRAQTESATDAA